jgi:hypothetical protein
MGPVRCPPALAGGAATGSRRRTLVPRLLVLVVALLALALAAPAAALAQDASPAASPAVRCLAPPEPLATPAPAVATPAAAPGTAPAGTPAGAELLERIRAAEENLAACLTAGDYRAHAALVTPRYRQAFFGTADLAVMAAQLEAAGPFAVEIVSVADAQEHADGRISAAVVYRLQGEEHHTRDFYVEAGGWLLLDEEAPLPAGAEATPAP